MRLLLIRHGQTPSNVLGLLDTAVPGPGLTDLGRQQAAALPETLAEYRIDAVFASSQVRAQLTAAPIAADRNLEVRIRDGLREISAGDLEMLGDERSIRTYQHTIRRWMTGELELTMPGGPSGAEVLARFDAVVNEVVDLLGGLVGSDEAGGAGGLGAVGRDGAGVAGGRGTVGSDGVGVGVAGPRGGSLDTAGTAVLVAHGAVLRLWATVRASDLASVEGVLGHGHSLHNTGMIVVSRWPDGGWQVDSWAGRPIGGPRLADESAEDPTGEDF